MECERHWGESAGDGDLHATEQMETTNERRTLIRTFACKCKREKKNQFRFSVQFTSAIAAVGVSRQTIRQYFGNEKNMKLETRDKSSNEIKSIFPFKRSE